MCRCGPAFRANDRVDSPFKGFDCKSGEEFKAIISTRMMVACEVILSTSESRNLSVAAEKLSKATWDVVEENFAADFECDVTSGFRGGNCDGNLEVEQLWELEAEELKESEEKEKKAQEIIPRVLPYEGFYAKVKAFQRKIRLVSQTMLKLAMNFQTFSTPKLAWSVMLLTLWIFLAAVPILAINHEGAALLEFGSRLNNTRDSLSNWNSFDSTPCRWTGVVCSSNLQVTSINLSGLQLEGNLTLDVTRLIFLEALNLSCNAFRGDIPALLGQCTSLRELNLHTNFFTGVIPPAVALLVNLVHLDLSNNQLQGMIPEGMNGLSTLSHLNLSDNMLEGSVPAGGVLASFGVTSYAGNSKLCFDRRCGRVRSLVDINNSHIPESDFHRYSRRVVRKTAASGGKKGLTVGAIVAICVSAFLASKIFLGTLCYCRWKKMNSTCEVKLSGGKMVMFQLSGKVTPSSKTVLKQAEKLKPQDVIGSGGYGTVYKLVLDDSTAFAVKKLARGGEDRERGFERELETLADIKHRNLVSLRGYYSAPHINILIYDLMQNGNLDTLLHEYRKRRAKPLDWDLRLSIALGSARGLSYLHHDCIPHIIHRDIKTSNILLDAEMEAHVADFGLAKLINPQETHVTTIVAGTLGYLPPEYMETGKITEKGDVFSFGIVLLELLIGKRPTDDLFRDNDFNMVQWAKNHLDESHPEDIFDEYILGTCPDDDLLTTLDIALQCVNPLSAMRPSMQQVVKMLERVRGDIGSVGSSIGLSSQLSGSLHNGTNSTTSSSDQSF